jgi:hydrogenase maturation protease
MTPKILLIGIGNEYRGDDCAGLAAIRALKVKGLPGTLLKECTSDGADLMEMWSEAKMVILIDAVSSGAQAGTIYRFDAWTLSIPVGFSFHSTHAFGVAEAIELARELNLLPPTLIVYAIEGKNFTTGIDLSWEVEKALQEVVERIACEVLDALINPLLSLSATHPRSIS